MSFHAHFAAIAQVRLIVSIDKQTAKWWRRKEIGMASSWIEFARGIDYGTHLRASAFYSTTEWFLINNSDSCETLLACHSLIDNASSVILIKIFWNVKHQLMWFHLYFWFQISIRNVSCELNNESFHEPSWWVDLHSFSSFLSLSTSWGKNLLKIRA